MWLATKFGFYSIVQDKKNRNQFKVRTRDKKDLESLRKIEEFKNRKIHFDSLADYHYRIFITKNELTVLMKYLSDNLDYDNFKDKIKEEVSQKDKLPYYTRIWTIMYEYQYRFNKKFSFNVFYK